MVSTRASRALIVSGLQDESRKPETNGKRSRDDSDEPGLYPPTKRQTFSPFTPRASSSTYSDLPHGLRGWRTDPGRNRAATPRRIPRAGLKHTPSRQIHASAQHRIAQLNARSQRNNVEMADASRQSQKEVTELQQPQSIQQEQQAAGADTQAPEPQRQDAQSIAPETPSRIPSLFRKVLDFVPTPGKLFALSPSKPAAEIPQPQPSPEDPAFERTETPAEPAPRIGRSIFSDKPSAYHTPASELDKLEKKQALPAKKTNKEIEATLRKEAAAIMRRNRELGYAAPDAPDSDPPEDTPLQPSSTGEKRKLSAIDGMLPGPKSGAFGISDEYLDQENHIEGVDEFAPDSGPMMETPTAKRQKTTILQTPRSALKRPANSSEGGTLLRSQKKVVFNPNPVASIRGLTASYGRAGHYNGSTFADTPIRSDDDSFSSFTSADALSPRTTMNTLENERVDRTMNPNTRDPNDPNWRPSPANPRPGQFCLPDFDDDDDEMSIIQEEGGAVTAPPASPRPAHASLPTSAAAASSTFFNESSTLFDSSDVALNKARLAAEKYKPKDSSRLSEVEIARSRSSSPPLSESAKGVGAGNGTTKKPSPSSTNADSDKENEPSPEDNNRDANGLNEYDRRHYYDDWANNIQWPYAPTRVEAGYVSQETMDYIIANWGPEDERQSAEFWDAEFARIDSIINDAKKQGREVEFVYD